MELGARRPEEVAGRERERRSRHLHQDYLRYGTVRGGGRGGGRRKRGGGGYCRYLPLSLLLSLPTTVATTYSTTVATTYSTTVATTFSTIR